MLHVGEEAPGDVHRHFFMPVVLQAFGGHPLQRCPAVWRIPLLAAIYGRRGDPPGFDQLGLGGRSRFICPLLGSRLDVQREQRRSGQLITHLFGFQIVIRIPALFFVPQIALHRLLAIGRQTLVAAGGSAIAAILTGLRQQFFHLEHQGVQIHRHDAGGADRPQLLRIVHPAGAKVPARGGCGAQIAVDLGRRAAGVFFRGVDVIQPGFRAWRITIVPVAVKHGTIVQFDYPLAGLTRLEGIHPFHPVGVLFFHLRTVFFQRLAVVRRQQFHHQGEERRLGAAQIVAAVPVGNMAPAVQLISKVIDHAGDLIPVSTLGQAQHGEVAIPVIDLPETSPRHHVRLRQRQQRIPLPGAGGGARQHRPQTVDMRAQALPGRRNVFFLFGWQGKVHVDKMTQVEAGLFSLHVVISEDRLGIVFRHRIGKGFLVREEFRGLHIIKQGAKQDVRRLFQAAG